MRNCSDMRYLLGPRTDLSDEPARAVNLSEGPQGQRQLGHRGYTGILSEAKSEIAVSFGVEHGKRLFQVPSRFDEIPCEPVGYPLDSMRHASSDSLGSAFSGRVCVSR